MKIDNEYVVGEVKQIRPQIFAVAIKDAYQRNMLFCRYIEYYDSPYDEIRGKFFTWEKFMAIYRKETENDVFTYPEDWGGFSISSVMLEKALEVFKKDGGPYDDIMADIVSHCNKEFGKDKKKWYLIGVDNFTSETLDHEVAHGLYDTNAEYQKNVDTLIKGIDKKDYETMRKKIVDAGYIDDKDTVDNEIQALMSTGLWDEFETKTLEKYEAGFRKNFDKYNKSSQNEGRLSLKNLLPK